MGKKAEKGIQKKKKKRKDGSHFIFQILFFAISFCLSIQYKSLG